MPETTHFRVLMFEVPRPPAPTALSPEPAYVLAPKPTPLPGFGVDARSPDHAMTAARSRAAERGYTLKGSAFCKIPDTGKDGIVLYVYPKGPAL